ncbi:tyrosine-type recombinase/integrase [Bacillus badius]|uniref:tyrosine-type recombinase/integrase n=1 Tax=Bacillus badius TaxID=1455 RepID=UPI002E1F3D0E|nr:tyrosine-type recombinase/integrase [Bacillus badius]MED0665945.1 tyrosine-type recombinase/integrase [Bacillus badius]
MIWAEAKSQFLSQLLTEATRKGYSQNLLQFEHYLNSEIMISSFQVGEVKNCHIKRYLAYLEIEKQCQASTCQRHFYALSSFFTFAFNKGWITTRPTQGIELKEINKQAPVFITAKECMALVQTIENPVIAMAVLCQFQTGLRVAECLALRIEDICFNKKEIFVRNGKGGKLRTVPLNDRFIKVLVHYLEYDRPKTESTLVFATKRTGQLSPAYINREIRKATQKLGWKQRVTCHTLRHSYATHHLNRGMPIVQIQRWLGHESLASTGIYAHLETDRAMDISPVVI